MNLKEGIKKYWFVGVIAILLLGFVLAYGINALRTKEVKVSHLTNDGKDVVYTLDDTYYYADDLYNDLYTAYGRQLGFASYYKAVIDEAIPTTEELSNYASNWAAYILENNDEAEVLDALRQSGYGSKDDLARYCLDSLKYDQLMSDYYQEHFEDMIRPAIKEENPRYISHILVKVADVVKGTDDDGNETITLNPTAEETKKLNDALEALKTKEFAEVAKEFSEDGSAADGGTLGLVYESNKTKYVKPFYEKAMTLTPGGNYEVCESEYGYHIMIAEAISDDDAWADQEFSEVIRGHYPNEDLKVIQAHATELGYEIKDENIKNYMNQYLEGAN